MECPPPSVFIDFVAGRLPAEPAAAFELHLDGCPPCRSALAELADPPATDSLPEMAASPELIPRGQTIGRYVVLARIGAGAMGALFSAYDPELDRKVALKFVLSSGEQPGPEQQARLVQEAKALARVRHANVVSVHDVGTWNRRVWIALELVDGLSLRDWMARSARGWREVVEVFRQAARGLQAVHAAGLVHRDFKPDNVLVGNDGVVRVADFGLARQEGPAAGVHTGSLVGTPAYWAPELRAGAPADAKSDQFALCVSLHEALCGGRPPSAEGRTRLPAWLDRLLTRGLDPDPARRFPSVKALADALREPLPGSAKRWALAAGLAVLLAGAGAGGWWRSRPCQGLSDGLRSAWSEERLQQVHAAFARTGAPYAETAFATSRDLLNLYGHSWAEMRADACRATRVRGEQSEELLDRRMQCLDDRLRDLKALADVFEAGGLEVVDHSVDAASRLPSLDACADRASLLSPIPIPADPRARATVDAVRTRLAEARERANSGQYADALTRAEDAERSSEAVGFAPLQAEALQVIADVDNLLGKPQDASAKLWEAVLLADQGRDDRARFDSLAAAVKVESLRTQYAEAHRALRLAGAVYSRLGATSAEMDRRLASATGFLAYEEGRYDDALAADERALRLAEASGDHGRELRNAMVNLANALLGLGRYAEAEASYRRVAELAERAYGPAHPAYAGYLGSLAAALRAEGKVEEARDLATRAVEIQRRTLGPDHRAVAGSLSILATVHLALGQASEALGEFQEMLRIDEKVYGPDSALVVYALLNVADSQRRLGHLPASWEALHQAVDITERSPPPSRSTVADVQAGLGAYLAATGKQEEAAEHYQQAVEIRQAALGGSHPDLTADLLGLAEAHLARRRPREALASLERASEILRAHTAGDPSDEPRLAFDLARALWESNADRRRARTEAAKARVLYTRAASRFQPELASLDEWLRAHP